MPIEYVSEKNAEKYVQDILKWKMLYNYIKENHVENKIDDKQMQTMFQKLHIDNLNFTTLHTLIFLKMLLIVNYSIEVLIILINYSLD